MLVVDASTALTACASPDGFAQFGKEQLFAPPLLWSECRSVLHERVWRLELEEELAIRSLDVLQRGPIRARTHGRLGITAWTIAGELGWAKTYDAEYLALAQLLRCRLVTLDARLRRGADRLGFVVGPTEL
ncbi:MAG TPA: type II toxin-antitoxin system VapC family toxin [Actinomycetota bacterium]|nr:type II toxin-antitoxin system VapC family toxin [Actinomycetota bacterium]